MAVVDGFGVHAVLAVYPEALLGEADGCLFVEADEAVARFAE